MQRPPHIPIQIAMQQECDPAATLSGLHLALNLSSQRQSCVLRAPHHELHFLALRVFVRMGRPSPLVSLSMHQSKSRSGGCVVCTHLFFLSECIPLRQRIHSQPIQCLVYFRMSSCRRRHAPERYPWQLPSPALDQPVHVVVGEVVSPRRINSGHVATC